MSRYWIHLDLDHPLVAWEVYRGILISSSQNQVDEFTPLSLWYAYSLGILLEQNPQAKTEFALEKIREELYPHKVSRLSGLFLYKDYDSAIRALKKSGGSMKRENLFKVDVFNGKVTKVDQEWITQKLIRDGNYSDIEWMKKYWEEMPYNKEPLWELLLNGRAKIVGSEPVRKARNVIKSKFPKSLGLLEYSRAAALIGSDVGHIVPYLYIDRDRVYLKYVMDNRDTEDDPEFSKRMTRSQYFGQPLPDVDRSKITTLDLTPFEYDFKLEDWMNIVIAGQNNLL